MIWLAERAAQRGIVLALGDAASSLAAAAGEQQRGASRIRNERSVRAWPRS